MAFANTNIYSFFQHHITSPVHKMSHSKIGKAARESIQQQWGLSKENTNEEDRKIETVDTNDQLADILIKPLDEAWFCKLRNELNILAFSNMWREHLIYN